MSKKKSEFISIDSVPDDYSFNVFGNGVDRKIPKPDVFNQIKSYIGYKEFGTVAEMSLSSPDEGSRLITKGCLSIGDGGHGIFIVEAASGTPDGYSRVLLANGNHAVLQPVNHFVNLYQFGGINDDSIERASDFVTGTNTRIMVGEDITVKVPKAGSIKRVLNRFVALAEVSVTIEIESGYQIPSTIDIYNMDLSYFTITSVDSVVDVVSGFTGDILLFDNCNAPVIDFLCDAANGSGTVERGFCYINTSRGVIMPNAGCINVVAGTPGGDKGNGLFVENISRVNASNAIFKGCNLRNVHVTTGSDVELSGADVSEGIGDWNVWVSRRSKCVLDGATIGNNSVGGGLSVKRSEVSMVPFSTGNLDCSGNATINILADDASLIFAGTRSGTIVDASGAGTVGVQADGGSTINVERINVSGCGSSGLLANKASTISADQANASGCGGQAAVFANAGSTIDFGAGNATGYTGTNAIRSQRGSTINAHLASARQAGVDQTTDFVIAAGSHLNASGATGGVSAAANTLTINGVIYK